VSVASWAVAVAVGVAAVLLVGRGWWRPTRTDRFLPRRVVPGGGPLGISNFRWFVLGHFVASLTGSAASVALVWVVLQDFGGSALSVVIILQDLPLLLFSCRSGCWPTGTANA
jgi:hypothetical protein